MKIHKQMLHSFVPLVELLGSVEADEPLLDLFRIVGDEVDDLLVVEAHLDAVLAFVDELANEAGVDTHHIFQADYFNVVLLDFPLEVHICFPLQPLVVLFLLELDKFTLARLQHEVEKLLFLFQVALSQEMSLHCTH